MLPGGEPALAKCQARLRMTWSREKRLSRFVQSRARRASSPLPYPSPAQAPSRSPGAVGGAACCRHFVRVEVSVCCALREMCTSRPSRALLQEGCEFDLISLHVSWLPGGGKRWWIWSPYYPAITVARLLDEIQKMLKVNKNKGEYLLGYLK